MTIKRKNYSQRYPIRSRVQAIIATIALAVLILPYFPKISVSIQPALAGEGIQRGSGRTEP